MRRAHRLDNNHKELADAFEKLGCSVLSLAGLGRGAPDICVGFGGLQIMCELKDGSKPPSARKLTPDEEKFRMNWKGGYKLVENLDHVLETVNVLKGWQAAILAFHRTVLVAPPVTKGKAKLEAPGCVFCMEVGTPVKEGEFCPKCGDKMPTEEEHREMAIKLNLIADDYDLTSNDTRRGD